MASIGKDSGGRKRILFVGPDGKRRTIRLGKVSQRAADGFRLRVEHLVAAKLGVAVDSDTAAWLAELGDDLHRKLVAVGLAESRDKGRQATLGPFLDSYFAIRTDVKPSTATVWGHTRRCLLAFFGANKPLAKINQGDADDFRRFLATKEKLAENTIRRRCGIAKQFLRAAVRKKLIAENPFADMKACSVRGNRERDYFLSRADADRINEACPDAQWRLIFALSRYGGLRCPSEHLALTWDDVDWGRERLRITSPKTEHHEGGESRVIPMFPELLKPLMEAAEAADKGEQFVVTRYRDATQNLRTQFQRIIKRAGLEPWPKLFHNLRATRQTELAAKHPAHVVCEWIGNSIAVANEHYLRVTDADFQSATTTGGAAQNAAQQPQEIGGIEKNANGTAHKKTPVLPRFSDSCDIVQTCTVGRPGLEQPAQTSEKTAIAEQRGTECGTVGAADPELLQLVELWPRLDKAGRAAVVGMVAALAGRDVE